MLKDKLFFFVNYDGQRNTQTQPIVPNICPTGAALTALQQYLTPYAVGLNNDVFLAKADWNIGQTDRFSVRYNGSRYTGSNFESNGLTSAREHTGDNKVTTDNIAAVYTKVFGTSLVWDARFNYVRDDEPGQANATGPEVVITNGITFGKNNFSPRYTNAYTYQPVNTLSWVKGTPQHQIRRRHQLRKGRQLLPRLVCRLLHLPQLCRLPAPARPAATSRRSRPPGPTRRSAIPTSTNTRFSRRIAGA